MPIYKGLQRFTKVYKGEGGEAKWVRGVESGEKGSKVVT